MLLLCVKKLKHIRIVLSLLMLGECMALALLWPSAPKHAVLAGQLELSTSLFASTLAASIGVLAIWVVVTLLLGRVYCAAFCPVGTVMDIVRAGQRKLTGKALICRKREGKPIRWWILGVYAVAVAIGAGIVPLLLEPWPAFVNIVQQLSGQGGEHHAMVVSLGVSGLWGLVCGLVSLLLFIAYSLATGRDFCNDVCPVGSLLALSSHGSAMHIELIPDKCNSCLLCEDVCKAGCIDIKTRRVDNARCLRCFNCVTVCPNDAIRYQLNSNGILTPMFRRTTAQT